MTFIGKKLRHKIKRNFFLPRLMKLCILVAYKFFMKKLNFGFNQCISGHVISHVIYMICHISTIFKDRDFWFGPKNSIKLCAENFTILGVIECISGHMTAH